MGGLLPLRLEGGVVVRRGVRLIGPISFQIDGPGTTVVLGPNGAGKTTFLRLLHGLERLREGKLMWAAEAAMVRRGQAYVFQTPTLLRRSVQDNVAYPLRLRGAARAAARSRAIAALEEVGLAEFANRPARGLSGGERQKLAIARALVIDPEVLFLDEPTASLDGRATREIEAILQRVRARGARVVMATHSVGQARRLADDVVFLLGGHVAEAGPADSFFDSPQSDAGRAFLNGDIVE